MVHSEIKTRVTVFNPVKHLEYDYKPLLISSFNLMPSSGIKLINIKLLLKIIIVRIGISLATCMRAIHGAKRWGVKTFETNSSFKKLLSSC